MYDVAIIGCGVIGAATAYALSRYENKVVILEAENDVADCTTKANSAILHAGYDPAPGTKMARLNVRGVELAKEMFPTSSAAPSCWLCPRASCPTCSTCTRTARPTACPI